MSATPTRYWVLKTESGDYFMGFDRTKGHTLVVKRQWQTPRFEEEMARELAALLNMKPVRVTSKASPLAGTETKEGS